MLGVPPKIGAAVDVAFESLPKRGGDVPFVFGVPNIDELFWVLAPNVLEPPKIEETLLFSCDGVPKMEQGFASPKIDDDEALVVLPSPNIDGVPCLLPNNLLETFATAL